MTQTALNPSPKDPEEKPKKKARSCTVVSVDRSSGPDGATGDDWYKYVINSPGSMITGYRRGKMREVQAYLIECTEKLDERLNSGKTPRAPSGRKPAQAQTSS